MLWDVHIFLWSLLPIRLSQPFDVVRARFNCLILLNIVSLTIFSFCSSPNQHLVSGESTNVWVVISAALICMFSSSLLFSVPSCSIFKFDKQCFILCPFGGSNCILFDCVKFNSSVIFGVILKVCVVKLGCSTDYLISYIIVLPFGFCGNVLGSLK